MKLLTNCAAWCRGQETASAHAPSAWRDHSKCTARELSFGQASHPCPVAHLMLWCSCLGTDPDRPMLTPFAACKITHCGHVSHRQQASTAKSRQSSTAAGGETLRGPAQRLGQSQLRSMQAYGWFADNVCPTAARREHLYKKVRIRQVGDRTPLRGSEGGRVRQRAAQLLGAHFCGNHPEAGRLSLSGAAACGAPVRVRVQGLG